MLNLAAILVARAFPMGQLAAFLSGRGSADSGPVASQTEMKGYWHHSFVLFLSFLSERVNSVLWFHHPRGRVF